MSTKHHQNKWSGCHL